MKDKPDNLGVYPGTTLTEIVLREHDLTLVFTMPSVYPPQIPRTLSIGVHGKWELRKPDGTVLDCSRDHQARSEYRIHRMIGKNVVKASLSRPLNYHFVFDDGYEFRMLPDSSKNGA